MIGDRSVMIYVSAKQTPDARQFRTCPRVRERHSIYTSRNPMVSDASSLTLSDDYKRSVEFLCPIAFLRAF
ncbi:hypothetical protein GCM10007868_01710 [Gluconobacter frateurii]|uniref:Transposase n=1 Tax=Gluconobacter frateurii NRIC 0228 TaxID=1307946 RepID=A0ABQ0QAX1_9PROT|nr:hypothetical protein AA0228_1365 [Gluconobacter frateurii NRIC 0228]GLP89096.1 hypothetical protein GCM10007868_01710 [Gluconobacter frateurii]